MPLTLPYNYYTYKILAIDPGTHSTGLAIFDMDCSTGSILSIEALTLYSNHLPNNTGLDPELVPERIINHYKLKFAVMYYLNLIKPVAVAYETPFYNRFRPTAYGPLMELMATIRSGIFDYNPNLPFVTVEPLLVKKAVGTRSQKGKLSVKQAVLLVEDIMSVLKNNIDTLDEHAIDAIAVGYAGVLYKGL